MRHQEDKGMDTARTSTVQAPGKHSADPVQGTDEHQAEHNPDRYAALQLLSPKDVAARLGCSTSHVYALINRGALEAYRIGRRGVRISEASLNRHIETLRAEPCE